MEIEGQVLSNVVALASDGSRSALALKRNGTVAARGEKDTAPISMPSGLSNIVAIAGGRYNGLALNNDGTVAAWGNDNQFGQASAPVGLSNVVAIASGGDFNLAIATGSIPPSIFVQPHGQLEELERKAGLVFKGVAVSSAVVINPAFLVRAEVCANQFKVISVMQGTVQTNLVTFQHYASSFRGCWSGPRPPEYYRFEIGEPYLIFSASLLKPDMFYDPTRMHISVESNDFREIYGGGVIRTLDARPLSDVSVKEAHWIELNRFLNDKNPTNVLYAIDQLDRMSFAHRGDDEWAHSDDFKRNAVLSALLPLTTNSNEQIASRAINCFGVASDVVAILEPFAGRLIEVANNGPSANRRLNAIGALSGTHFEDISNSLAQLLNDANANVRATAVGLLALFPNDSSRQALRERSADGSPIVRAEVADVIGSGKIENLLPTLVKLFADPVGLTNTLQDIRAGGRPNIQGDVHTSAGFARLNFDVDQVSEILKTNISDKGFCLNFIRKLAPNGAEPYFPILAEELKAHTANSEQEAATNGFHWPLSYWLIGNYGWAWDTLFAYVSKQSREAITAPRISPILDALQIADDPSDDRTRSLYEFFLDKGMIERAKELRRGIIRRTEDKNINRESFGFPEKLKVFDEMDEEHSLEPGLGL